MEANMNAWRDTMEACLQKTAAYLERKEPTPVEMANVEVYPENS
jgi:hypothetical protein